MPTGGDSEMYDLLTFEPLHNPTCGAVGPVEAVYDRVYITGLANNSLMVAGRRKRNVFIHSEGSSVVISDFFRHTRR